MNLFDEVYENKKPLAFRYRPKSLDDFYGQEKLVGEKGVLKRIIEKGTFMNSIFWGAPGTGKTTFAEIIANRMNYNYEYLDDFTYSTYTYSYFCIIHLYKSKR